ncbi:SecDF P1 head subdomain-containing protein [Winogradskyella ouciana]|uniref:SecDF P1 head subdomain-containing protein n=1 Tax=Winogradskyella ouciana TaxID=2608631 RepID=UPI003D2E68F3
MKKLTILLGLILIFSCGNLFHNEKHDITYAFVNAQDVSDSEKQTTVKVIQKRLSKYLRNVEVRLNSNDEIVVTLDSGFDVEGVNQVVENQGKLDFWPCAKSDKIISFILEADKVIANDSVTKPLSSLVQGMAYDGLPTFSVKDTIQVRKILNNEKVQNLYFDEFKDLKFLFGLPNDGYVELYGLESNQKERAPVNDSHIIEARQDYDQIGRPAISLKMNEYGGHKWYQMTNDAYLNQTKIAITLNDIVYSAPSVSSGPITVGSSQISGSFTLEQAIDLSNVLSSQQMIPKLKFTSLKKLEEEDL